ncbi:hypothetical protein [Bathymodiolus platifrons methanotrophic gill symbiont]|nr:hypothetical protein [Bathymodiolus platifrons methanotrophic gill symbiont]
MSLEVNMSNENKQSKPKYTLEFKQDAEKLVLKMDIRDNELPTI